MTFFRHISACLLLLFLYPSQRYPLSSNLVFKLSCHVSFVLLGLAFVQAGCLSRFCLIFMHGKSFWNSVSAEQATLSMGFSPIAFCGSQITWGNYHRGWFTEASSLIIILAFYGMEGEHTGIFPFAFGLEIMGSGDAIARLGLAFGVVLHSRSVLSCLVLYFALMEERSISFSSSCLPSLDFDSIGAGYHHMSVVRTILPPL